MVGDLYHTVCISGNFVWLYFRECSKKKRTLKSLNRYSYLFSMHNLFSIPIYSVYIFLYSLEKITRYTTHRKKFELLNFCELDSNGHFVKTKLRICASNICEINFCEKRNVTKFAKI